jgi:hypothetical protein
MKKKYVFRKLPADIDRQQEVALLQRAVFVKPMTFDVTPRADGDKPYIRVFAYRPTDRKL